MTGQEIPEGTVTVLFTDLVESTHLNQTLGDEASRQIGREVEEMARHAVASNRGALIKEMGDGLMAAFASARRAIAAARDMQIQMRYLHRNGLDAEVANFVLESERGANLFKRILDLIGYLLPLNDEEGKLKMRGYVGFFYRTQSWLPARQGDAVSGNF